MNRSSKNRKQELRMGARGRRKYPESYVPKQLSIIPNREQGAWIAYQMKLQDFNLVTMAECAGVSMQMIHAVIYGKKTSGRVQKIIAHSLRYDSWADLLAAREGVAA
jgi:hypothetical protein